MSVNICSRIASMLSFVFLLAACSDSGTEPGDPPPPDPDPVSTFYSLEVDARESWAFVDLGPESAQIVNVAEPTESALWDLAFYGTEIMVNGGAAGPGGAEAYCICQNAEATDAQVTSFTAEAALSEFEALTLAGFPSDDDAWQGDALLPAVRDWYTEDPATQAIAPAEGVLYLFRTAEGSAIVKLQITSIEGATREHAGTVTLRYAVQTEAGAALGPVQEMVLDASSGVVYVDFLTGNAQADETDWDLSLSGFTFRVNGGVSGSGMAGAGRLVADFDTIPDLNIVPPNIYIGDVFGGVFSDSDLDRRWYRYNLQGNHQIWPTFNLFGVRRDGVTYKFQVISYYNQTGDSRHVTFRYFPL